MTLEFSQRGQALIGQAMFSILDKAKKYEQQGHKVYHLELGDPAMAPPPSIIEGTVKALRDGRVGYCSPAGLMELREACIKVLSNGTSPRLKYSWKNVAISPANLLISQVLDIVCDVNTFQRVGLFMPAFPTYLAAIRYLGFQRQSITVSLLQEDRFHLTKANVEEMFFPLLPAAIIINSGNNPTGAVYDPEVLLYLLECCEKEGVWLIADETYQYLSQVPYYSLLQEEYERLIVISSFSKVLSIPAYRTGWVVAHPGVIEKITLSTSTLYSCLPVFNQLGILAGMDDFHGYAAKAREHYDFMNQAISQIINKSPVLSCHLPQSAFYLFIDIRKTGLTDIEFAEQLMEEKYIAVTPGEAFGYPGFIRVSTCGLWEDVLKGAKGMVELNRQGK